MRLWILRHGQAAAQAATDPERPLTGAGEQEVRSMCQILAGQPLDAILASPYLRAQQTASLVADQLNFARGVATAPWLTPDDAPADVLRYLSERSEQQLLLVSHQPLVSQLLSLLRGAPGRAFPDAYCRTGLCRYGRGCRRPSQGTYQALQSLPCGRPSST